MAKAPQRDVMMPPLFYQQLDIGIRFAVRVLHAHGIETCQSCQGGKGHSYPEPTVDLPATPMSPEGFEALAALRAYGLPVASVAIVWNVKDGLPYENVWRIAFSRTMEDRANDKPNFVWGYIAQ